MCHDTVTRGSTYSDDYCAERYQVQRCFAVLLCHFTHLELECLFRMTRYMNIHPNVYITCGILTGTNMTEWVLLSWVRHHSGESKQHGAWGSSVQPLYNRHKTEYHTVNHFHCGLWSQAVIWLGTCSQKYWVNIKEYSHCCLWQYTN
jgi:hypothetical protein